MIYLVSNQIEAFDNEFIPITVEKSKKLILNNKYKYIQYDSETGCKDQKGSSLDPHTGFIYSIQFGLYKDQIVVDCTTINIKEYKDIFESNKLRFVGQNLMFDIQWLFKNGIIIKNIYDTMIAEQILHLGEDNTKNAEYKCIDPLINPDYNKIYTEEEYLMYLYTLNHKFALKSLCWKYIGINLDKTVRGEINNEGLTTRVIRYAAGDVTYLNTIMEKQVALLKQENLLKAVLFEFKALIPITYMAFCGVKIDSSKWIAKSSSELPKLNKLKDIIYQDILDFYNKNKAPSINGKPYVNRVYIIEGADKVKREFSICEEKNIPTDADRDQKLFEDKIIYTWKVPFGYISKGKFIPYVIRNMQGDLFSGFNTELQVNNINLSSSIQLIPLLTIMGVDCMVMDKKTHDKKESFGKSIISLYEDKFPIIKHFGEYKALSKQLDSFGPKFLNNINYKTKRFYAQWHQLGTRTGRISSSSPNMQQLPSDSITRACFVAEPGNKFISCDYQSQESRLIASISKDKALIDLFNKGCGDAHSFVAKIAYPEIVGDCPIEEIKHKFHQQRQDAKKIEFAVNYAGDYNTIANNMSIPKAEAKRIYDNYMSGLSGVAKYQEYCKQIVLEKGYITLNPILGHKAYWWDKDACLAALDLYNNKDTVALTKLNNKLHFIKVKFNNSEEWSPVHLDNIMDYTDISLVKKKISDWKKRSVNFRIQGTGAMCFKNALIHFWDYLCKNNLVFIVLICLSIHDECDSEAPEEIADKVASNLLLCMKKGAAPFCTRVNLEADLSLDENNKLPNYWIH